MPQPAFVAVPFRLRPPGLPRVGPGTPRRPRSSRFHGPPELPAGHAVPTLSFGISCSGSVLCPLTDACVSQIHEIASKPTRKQAKPERGRTPRFSSRLPRRVAVWLWASPRNSLSRALVSSSQGQSSNGPRLMASARWKGQNADHMCGRVPGTCL